MRDLGSIASEAAESFESFKRPGDDETTLYRVKDGAPEWIGDMARDAHGDMLPDDWRYECVLDALHFLADNADMDEDADHAFADQQVDVYNAARFEWLASHLSRQGYVDQATEEFGHADSVTDAIGRGQYLEAMEVFAIVRAALVERLDEDEDDDDDDEDDDEKCPQCGGSGQRATALTANGRELERHERSGTRCDECLGTGLAFEDNERG